RERGDRGSIAIDLLNLAWVLIRRGFGDLGREILSEGFAIADEIGSKSVGVALLGVASHLAPHLGDWKLAARFYGAVRSFSEQEGLHSEPGNKAADASFIARTREALGSVAFAAAESEGRTLAYDDAIAEARSWLEQRS